ncbi:nitrite reductase small subunit NirD [Pseudomonas sp. nanlin1]|uniref:nitrite reductase small subunit NirD n=1 Tax=Pseudomonas sp. nanlin1 TaxID=3040605 RepID=UPI00388F1AB6
MSSFNQVNPAVSQNPWQPVCRQADLVANSGVVVWLDGAQVALFYLPGQEQTLYAIDHHDPQANANVIGRGIIGRIQGQLVVASPLYKQHYVLSDGRCLETPEQQLRTWPVRLNGEAVEIARG